MSFLAYSSIALMMNDGEKEYYMKAINIQSGRPTAPPPANREVFVEKQRGKRGFFESCLDLVRKLFS